MKFPGAGVVRLILLTGLLHVAMERQALAYLDPGSTSYALQMVIAGAVAVAFAVKSYWAKLKSFFAGSDTPSEKSKEVSDGSPTGGAAS